ncbi:DUF302 domain-containing protein [Archaeoglobus sp.]
MEFVKSFESRYGFEETVERLKDACEKRGWKVANVLNMKENLGKDVVIVEICKKEFAERVLSDEKNYWISAMMPCRFAVCKQGNGVFVYGMNMEVFAQMIEGEVGKILQEVAEEEKAILSSLNG